MGQFVGGYIDKRSQAVAIARPLPMERGKSWQMSVAVAFIFASLIVGAAASFYRQTRAEMASALVQEQQEAKRVRDLQIQIARTQEEIRDIRTNPRVIESMARENLGFVRTGDVVVRIRTQ